MELLNTVFTRYPWAFWVLLVLGIGFGIAWFAAPVTWRDGEGGNSERSHDAANGWRGFFNLHDIWKL